MKTYRIFLLTAILAAPAANAATTCSRANLTRCLDSVCAINVSSNPAARCQYCGTANAGTPPNAKKMNSVSVGTSAKYNISDKELKSAPSDPGERYAWATTQCTQKVSGCTPDDVSAAYDKLIEQSCRAAGISIQMTQTLDKMAKKKSKTVCSSEIKSCLIQDQHCTADFRNCAEDADFNRFFSECTVSATGCDDYISSIRSNLISARDSAIKNSESILTQIIASHQNAREKRINNIKSGCADNTTRDACVETVCANNMPNKCSNNNKSEHAMALQLCKFYETACNTIR